MKTKILFILFCLGSVCDLCAQEVANIYARTRTFVEDGYMHIPEHTRSHSGSL